MRAVGCFAADAVFYNGSRYDVAEKYQRQYRTDTNNVKQKIPLTKVDDLLSAVPDDCELVCVELVEGATPLTEFVHPAKAFYLFGPEDNSLTQQVVDKAKHVVYVPTIGCLNLASTVNVVLYDRMSKLNPDIASDQLVRDSRDRNNKVKVKD